MSIKTYLSGPMTGHADLNFPLFHATATRLRAAGLDVVNPAELNAAPDTPWDICMRADIGALMECQAIAMMPGWMESRGARLERHIAVSLGMKVTYLEAVA